MFFVLSKIIWAIFAPSRLILWTSIAAAVLLTMGLLRIGRILAIVSASLLILLGVFPSYTWLLRPLEYQYGQPRPMPARLDGILTLGGYDLMDRLATTNALARLYPDARVVFSGGSGNLIDTQPGVDSQIARAFFSGAGLDLRRVTFEDRSRNTWENLLYTQRIVHPKPSGTWLLAISALQLPRAMEIANRLHWKLVPWPTNHISQRHGLSGYFDIIYNLMAFDNALHEWVGIFAYRWSGKADAAFHT